MKKSFLIITIILSTAVITACGKDNFKSTGNGVNLANPASAKCTQDGGDLKIVDSTEGQQGICVFPDGSKCDEWAYFRGQCAPKKAIKPAQPDSADTVDTGAECATDYKPVCAKVQIQCIKAPCNPVFETIDNSCLARKRGNMILGMTNGKCEKETGQECLTNKDCQLPMDYAVQSSCPFKAACVDKTCVVVCPN